MLTLLQTPAWRLDGRRLDLPATVPGWLIAYLALAGDWLSRDRIATVFWPDASPAEASNNLRANLHRAKQVLDAWAQAGTLVAERRRVRLNLPTDVDALRRALSAAQWQRTLDLYRRPLLQEVTFDGFPALREWAQLERQALHRQWRSELLARAGARDTAPRQAFVIAERICELDPLDEDAVMRRMEALANMGQLAEAARVRDVYAERLHDELGVAPSAPFERSSAAILRTPPTAPPLQGSHAIRSGSLIGRHVELAQLEAMLRQPETRLLTLLGPGGVGKSRLAEAWRDSQTDPGAVSTHWVMLAQSTDLEDALAKIAGAMQHALAGSGTVQQQLQQALRTFDGIIVLDNAEQVSGLAAWLGAQLEAAPTVRWMITSREPIGIEGERVLAIEGLEHPDSGEAIPSAAEGRATAAMQLLEQRVKLLNPRFDLATQWLACVALVQRVGGWPLAIEMAAPALAAQPADHVLRDLAASLDTLAAGGTSEHARHDSVRASIALSWALLSPVQRSALAAMSVFEGGCTRPAALAVTHTSGPTLASLIARMLIQAAGAGRWQLHPLVRQFAAEKLADRGESVAADHARHFLAHLVDLAHRCRDDATAAVRAMESDIDNLTQAWHWAVTHRDLNSLAEAAVAWTHYCNVRGRASTVSRWLQDALDVAADREDARSALLLSLSNARYRAGDFDGAIALAEQAANAASACGDLVARRSALNVSALSLLHRGRVEEAGQCANEALAAARAASADAEVAQLANTCAMVAKNRGDFDSAVSLYEEAIAVHRRRGNHRSLATSLNNLGNAWRARGEGEKARQLFEECLRACESHGITSTRAFALGNLGLVAYEDGRLEAARRYGERTLSEPDAETVMTMGAHGLLARVAVDERRSDDAARHVQMLARHARKTGMHMGMLEAVHCLALGLAAHGDRSKAAATLSFVARHPRAAAMARAVAERDLEKMQLDPDSAQLAAQHAQSLDLDVLVDTAMSVEWTQGTPDLCAETHETWLEDDRYVNMELLKEQKKAAMKPAA